MRARIENDEITLENKIEEERNNEDLGYSYEIYLIKDNTIFGKVVMSGSRLDAWAIHRHYIAVRQKDLKILGWLHKYNGWYGNDSEISVADFKRKMIEKAKELK